MAAGVTIYALCEPDSDEVRYVGKAKYLPHRLAVHRHEAKCGKGDYYKVRWMRSLGDKQPRVKVLEVVSSDAWPEAERRWIAEMKRLGFRLTNWSAGGEVSPMEGRKHTEETKAKLRAKALARGSRPTGRTGIAPWNKGVSATAEARHRISASLMGKPAWNAGKKMTPEHIEKNRQSHVGIPWSAARRAAQDKRKGSTE